MHEKLEAISFDSPEEMIEYLAKARAEVDARPLSDEQAALSWGDYAIRFYDGLIIFIQVETQESLLKEDRETREAIQQRERANSLWCKCHSFLVPDGEYGYVHRSVLWPIPVTTFDEAQQVGFNVDAMGDRTRLVIEGVYYTHRDFLRSSSGS